MKTAKLILTGLFVFGALIIQAQSITTTSDITSVGLGAKTIGVDNTNIGRHSGSIGNNNTNLGKSSGLETTGNYNVFIGYNSGLKVQGDDGRVRHSLGNGNVFIGANTGVADDISDKLMIDNSATTTPLIWGNFAEDQLKFNGKVGVGFDFGSFPVMAGTVDVSGYNLFVNGGILTEEVRVMLQSQWADYVFEEDYNLPKLEEVEQFIKENKHLPNVPSAQEVAENGIELGEIAKVQQEKIEELTLYIIEQNKINKAQTEQLEEQQLEIDELKEQVRMLLENRK